LFKSLNNLAIANGDLCTTQVESKTEYF